MLPYSPESTDIRRWKVSTQRSSRNALSTILCQVLKSISDVSSCSNVSLLQSWHGSVRGKPPWWLGSFEGARVMYGNWHNRSPVTYSLSTPRKNYWRHVKNQRKLWKVSWLINSPMLSKQMRLKLLKFGVKTMHLIVTISRTFAGVSSDWLSVNAVLLNLARWHNLLRWNANVAAQEMVQFWIVTL